MLNGFLTPPLAPFTVALGIMLFIAFTEALGTLSALHRAIFWIRPCRISV